MSTEDKQPAVFKKLAELRPDTAGHNLTVKVYNTQPTHGISYSTCYDAEVCASTIPAAEPVLLHAGALLQLPV
jgi:hypothetical protein